MSRSKLLQFYNFKIPWSSGLRLQSAGYLSFRGTSCLAPSLGK